MVLIIQDENTNVKFNDPYKFVFLKSACDLKTYRNGSYIIMLINIDVDDEGIVEKYDFHFEELIASLNVIAVITNKDSEKLREICTYYKLSLLQMNY